ATREFATRQSLDTQRALVRQLEAVIQGDEAAIDNATVQLGYTTITSPIGGRTGMRLVDKGNTIRTTDPSGLVGHYAGAAALDDIRLATGCTRRRHGRNGTRPTQGFGL